MRLLYCLMFLFLALPASPVHAAELSIDCDYPGGNGVVERVDGDTIHIKPDLRDTEGWWFYWNFRVRGAAGRKLTFCFDERDAIGVRGPAVSDDAGKSWSWLTAGEWGGGPFTYRFTASADDVRFAFTIPYTQAEFDRFMAAHGDAPNLARDSLCKSAKGRDVELLRAGRLDGDPRFRVLVTARHHACEAMANYVLEGLLDAMLADDDDGHWFLRNVEVMAVPFMDKDGVEQGDQGKNRRPHDHNRDYIGPSIYPEVAALRTRARNWANGKLRVALDLHCPYLRGDHNEDIYIVGSQDEAMWRQQQAFGALLEKVNAKGLLPYRAAHNLPYGESWNKAGNYSTGRSFSRWAEGIEEIQLAASLEIPYANAGGKTVTPDTARAFGRSLARALRQYLESLPATSPAPVPVATANVHPRLTVMAKGLGSDSECGIGALVPWAERLWAVGYVAHIRGQGLGLYEIREDMTMRRHPASVTGTFANRLVHWPTGQAFIGPHAIDADGQVRTIEALKGERLAATCLHLTEPKRKVYFLGMEGGFWETDAVTLETRKLFDLCEELRITGARPHFKSACTAQGRVVVANNTYDEKEYLGERHAGRLAEWDGAAWRILEENPFVEVSASAGDASYGGNTLYAVGWNNASVILRALVDGNWRRYLLPKSSQSWDHAWNTEWTRIRHAVTERLLMDAHGTFFELPPFAYGGHIQGIRPICTHLRVVPDFCHWRGFFVMASDQIDHDAGQPQSGLWFGNFDDLWRMGKPTGWGGPWRDTPVKAGEVSDPFLMTGYDKKMLFISCKGDDPVEFAVEADVLGDGRWAPYETFRLTPKCPEVHHEFPAGFATQWIRVKAGAACTATVHFTYN